MGNFSHFKGIGVAKPEIYIYLRVGVETGFLAVVQKGEPAALASGPTRVAVRRAETEHEQNMDLAAAEANTGCWLIRMPTTPSAI